MKAITARYRADIFLLDATKDIRRPKVHSHIKVSNIFELKQKIGALQRRQSHPGASVAVTVVSNTKEHIIMQAFSSSDMYVRARCERGILNEK